MASATKAARKRADHRLTWLEDIVAYLERFVELPPVALPTLDLPPSCLLLSDNDIEDAAEMTRAEWRLGSGPIANVVLLLENHGFVMGRDRLGAETLDGLSRRGAADGRPYVLVGTDRGSAARWRFDAAHELGHLLLHGSVTPAELARPEIHKRVEEQAHRFAAAFLLPLAPFGEDLFGVNLDALLSLKPKWNVSIGMMVMRARNAGLLSPDEERRLWVGMSRRKWRTREPLDDTTPAEEPRVLRRAFELILRSGEQTAADVTARLALPTSDIESLAGLSPGYLSDFAPVSLLKPSLGGIERPEGPDAQLIQFPGT